MSRFGTIWFSLVTLILSASHGSAQQALTLIGEADQVELPFDYINGLIVIKAKIYDKHPVRLILDTGAENLILFNKDAALDMGLALGKKVELRGSDLETTIDAYICRKVRLQLDKSARILRDMIVLEEDYSDMDKSLGISIDGLIGGRAFWGLALELDFARKKIRLYKTQALSLTQKDEFHELDIEINDHKPYITTKLDPERGNDIPLKLLVDSGSALSLLLLVDSHPALKLPAIFVEGSLGRGLGGNIQGYIGKILSLRLNDYIHFPHLITHYQHIDDLPDPSIHNHRNGLLGNPILSRFHVIIDYVHAKMYIRPYRKYNQDLDFDKSGLLINAIGAKLDQFVITEVISGSPADKLNIKAGDRLKRIGIWPTKMLDLATINDKLSGRTGKKIKLKIDRNGQVLRKTIKLEDYIALKLTKRS